MESDESAIFSYFKSFNCAIEELPPKCQLEAINLQCNDRLKGKYQERGLIVLSKCLPSNEYTQLNHMLRDPYQYLAVSICMKRHFQR